MAKTMRFLLVVIVIGLACERVSAQRMYDEQPTDWQLSFMSGYMTGGTVVRTHVNGEQVSAKTKGGFLAGVRFGADSEYLGWELTTAGVFAKLDVDVDPASLLSFGNDSFMFLGNINAMIYPTGSDLADGRVRPFITAGPGLAHFTSDLSVADDKTMFDVNVGLGVKCLLGDTGDTFVRADWRWYYIVGSGAGLENSMYRQELSVGLGFRF